MGLRDRIVALAAHLATAPVPRRFRPAEGTREITLVASDGARIGAWVREAMGTGDEGAKGQHAEARATVILGHGYRDDRRQLWAPLAPAFVARGVRVMALDFRAHGTSDGDHITVGHDEALDVEAAIAHVRKTGATSHKPIIYIGFSMGAAAYLLAREEADAALLDSPYDTLEGAIHARLDLFRVPRRVLRRIDRLRPHPRFPATERVRPIDRVPHLTKPTLFLFAPKDWWISAETRARFGEALSESCTLEVLARGAHLHLHEEWRQRVLRFVDEQLAARE